jgi:hypothetical protein
MDVGPHGPHRQIGGVPTCADDCLGFLLSLLVIVPSSGCRSSSPAAVVISAVMDELPEQLFTQERELDSREGAIIVW